jgi:hypothetical protein
MLLGACYVDAEMYTMRTLSAVETSALYALRSRT